MKSRPSPIAYPTTVENAKVWGFDIIEPVGTPMAWIHDWTSAYAGWNRPMQGMMDLGELLGSMGSDLSKLEAGDVMAALCLMYRKDVFGLFDEIETEVDRETAKASYRDGILTVRLEKAETAKPRKIQITG